MQRPTRFPAMACAILGVCAVLSTVPAGAGTFLYNDGFVRAASGKFERFTVSGQATAGESIDDSESVTGSYIDSEGVYHGFLRQADGIITTFDPSGSIDTYAFGINNSQSIAGYYIDTSNVAHVFLRAADGTITSFDPTGSVYTFGCAINAGGLVAGFYQDGDATYHGFVRGTDGTITAFELPKSNDTQAVSINNEGTTTGAYASGSGR
jgi:hypothetical protein